MVANGYQKLPPQRPHVVRNWLQIVTLGAGSWQVTFEVSRIVDCGLCHETMQLTRCSAMA